MRLAFGAGPIGVELGSLRLDQVGVELNEILVLAFAIGLKSSMAIEIGDGRWEMWD